MTAEAPVTSTSSYPWDNVVHITDTIGGISFSASGVLISPTEVLTAAHVVYYENLGQATNIEVFPGQSDSLKPFGVYYASTDVHYYPVSDYFNKSTMSGTISPDSSNDFALIHLATPVDVPSPGLQIGYLSPLFTSGVVTVTGYPGLSGVMYSSTQTVTNGPSDESVLYGSTLGEGSSGGPVWLTSDGVPTVIGMVSTGNDETGAGTFVKLNSTSLDQITEWEKEDSSHPSTVAVSVLNIDQGPLDALSNGFVISDTAADVAGAIDSLNSDSHINAISLTDNGLPVLDLTTAQLSNDTAALNKITNSIFEVVANGAHDYYLNATSWISEVASSANFSFRNGATASVSGSSDFIDLLGSGDAVSLYNTAGNWDGVDGSDSTTYLTSAQSTVSGGNNSIDLLGAGDAVGLYNTTGNWDGIVGSESTVYLTSVQASVIGGDNFADLLGSGDAISLYSTASSWDGIDGSGSTVYLTSAQSTVSGGNNYIDLAGSDDALGLYNTAANWDGIVGSDSTIYLTDAQSSISGGNNQIILQGSGDEVSLYDTGSTPSAVNTASTWDGVQGSDSTIYLTNSQSYVTGDGDFIDLLGSGDAVDLYNLTGVSDTIDGSNASVYFNGGDASITGNGNTLDFSGNSSSTLRNSNLVAVAGTSEQFVFQSAFGQDEISGFSSTDTLQFSSSDFANWGALQSHISQSGPDTIITLDASDTLTLKGVTASTLNASEFKFA